MGLGNPDAIPCRGIVRKLLLEDSMKTLNASQMFPGGDSPSRFSSARALAFSLAESDADLIEPELVAWVDRRSNTASPVLEGCGGPNGWHDYGIAHDGRLEVDVGDVASFIFTESSQFDSYAHFGPGPYVNLRDSRGQDLVCLVGGKDCVPLDEWTSKLT
jgi:Domain of unknown function (DUF5619)